MPGGIPTIPGKLQNPIRALARAAYLFRGVFVQVAKGSAIEQILQERGAALDLADRTLDSWGDRLGMKVGGLLEIGDEEEPTSGKS
jgi:hypothetical protein